MKQIVFLFACLLIGCANTVSSSQIPSWVTNPPADSATWFYSVGIGKTKLDAKESALAELSQRLQSKVSTATQQFVESKNQQTELFLEVDTQISSDNFDFYNVSEVETAQDEHNHYVLIQLNRAVFFDARVKQTLTKLEQFSQGANDIEQISNYLKFIWYKPRLNKEKQLLRAFDIDIQQLTNLEQQLANRASQYIGQTPLQLIIADNSDEAFVQLLQTLLQEQGFVLSTNPSKLQLLVTGLNQKQGKSDFHFVTELSMQARFLINKQSVFQFSAKQTGFADSPMDSYQQAFSKLKQELLN